MSDCLWLLGQGEVPKMRWAEIVGLSATGDGADGAPRDAQSILDELRGRGLEVLDE